MGTLLPPSGKLSKLQNRPGNGNILIQVLCSLEKIIFLCILYILQLILRHNLSIVEKLSCNFKWFRNENQLKMKVLFALYLCNDRLSESLNNYLML